MKTPDVSAIRIKLVGLQERVFISCLRKFTFGERTSPGNERSEIKVFAEEHISHIRISMCHDATADPSANKIATFLHKNKPNVTSNVAHAIQCSDSCGQNDTNISVAAMLYVNIIY
jgi:hypothetical protein